MLQGEAQPALVEADDVPKESGHGSVFGGQQPLSVRQARLGKVGCAVGSFCVRSRMKYWLRVGVQVSASAKRSKQRRADRDGQRAEEHVPVTPVMAISGRKHHDGRDGRADQRNRDLAAARCEWPRSVPVRRRGAARCSRPPRWRRRSPVRRPPPARPASSG